MTAADAAALIALLANLAVGILDDVGGSEASDPGNSLTSQTCTITIKRGDATRRVHVDLTRHRQLVQFLQRFD